MAVVRIDCLCECEGCQKLFGVELPLTAKVTDWDEAVKKEVREGEAICYKWGVRGKATVDRMALDYYVTVQGGLLLCDDCSQKCDEVEGDLTQEQVEKILQKGDNQ